MTKPLSPAAQAVLDAALQVSNLSPTVPVVAAALVAVAEQVVPDEEGYKSGEVFLIAMNVRFKLLAIAAELEGQ